MCTFVIMGSKYQPVKEEEFEKILETFPRRSSTSTSGSTLLEDEEDSRHIQTRSRSSTWKIWLAQAVFFMFSLTIFTASFFQKPTTLEYVQQFFAYCEYSTVTTRPI